MAIEALKSRGVLIQAAAESDTVSFDDVKLTFLSPPKSEMSQSWVKDNDHSLVGLWTLSEKSQTQLALTTGDIESDAIYHMISAYRDLKPMIVEAPHHGAFKEQAAAWLEKLEPPIVLQSTGLRRINHPGWQQSRDRSRWLVTAIDGACSVEIDRSGNIRATAFHTLVETSK